MKQRMNLSKQTKRSNSSLLWVMLAWVALAVISRVVPHYPNVTAITALSVLSVSRLNRWLSMALVVISLIISDGLLAKIYGYPVFGSWTLMTYSGFMMMVLAASCVKSLKGWRLMFVLLGSSLGFWIWTNLGTWLLGGIYPHTLDGILACYTMALPFLRNALMGDWVWLAILVTAWHVCGAPERIRTSDLSLRRGSRYPAVPPGR